MSVRCWLRERGGKGRTTVGSAGAGAVGIHDEDARVLVSSRVADWRPSPNTKGLFVLPDLLTLVRLAHSVQQVVRVLEVHTVDAHPWDVL